MNCHQLNLIIFILKVINISGIVSEKTCALDRLFDCPDGETCIEVRNSSLGLCDCRNKYKRIGPGSACVLVNDSNQSSETSPRDTSTASVIAGGLFTAFLFVVIAVLLVFAARKHGWVHRVREKTMQMRSRHHDTVLVNQEDDPPLA